MRSNAVKTNRIFIVPPAARRVGHALAVEAGAPEPGMRSIPNSSDFKLTS